jgi:type IV pilus assembly protein PilB
MVAGVTYSQGLLDDEASELSPEGLQSLLRQDPDVLVLEELDSKASVVQALRLARGGMLVLATVQAADAASAVRRLLDLGVAPGSLAAALVGVLAQRRIRRCCQHCAATGPVDREMVRREPLAVARGHVARQPAGCPACSGRGYEGSLRIHELAVVNEGVSRVIAASGTLAELAHEMCAGGLAPLWRDGLDKVARGETALRELVREVELPYAQEAQQFPRRAKRGAERAPSDAPAEAS